MTHSERSGHRVDEAKLAALASLLAPLLPPGGVIHLVGELGAGKTTFARALLWSLGVRERVKSPTYSLLESYRLDEMDIHHLDLYRMAGAGELEWLGLADLADRAALLVIEWPERGGAAVPPPDLEIRLRHCGALREIEALAWSGKGELWRAVWLP